MSDEALLPEVEGMDPFLEAYLEPFRDWLAQPDVTEVLVNRPGEVWIEQRGQMTATTLQRSTIRCCSVLPSR